LQEFTEELVMWDPPAEHPLKRMFAGLAEHAFFSHLGVADPALIDYLSSLLSRFTHTDAVYRLRNFAGRPLTEIVEMTIEAEQLPSGGRTRREYYRHIGDFALFWTGVYPEALNAPGMRACKDQMVSYTWQGKLGYRKASEFAEGAFRDEAPVLRRLADEFEVCAIGLREVRREWEEMRKDVPPGTGLIR
jgi:hypothetical protein